MTYKIIEQSVCKDAMVLKHGDTVVVCQVYRSFKSGGIITHLVQTDAGPCYVHETPLEVRLVSVFEDTEIKGHCVKNGRWTLSEWKNDEWVEIIKDLPHGAAWADYPDAIRGVAATVIALRAKHLGLPIDVACRQAENTIRIGEKTQGLAKSLYEKLK